MQFVEATSIGLKLRLALTGPSGGGKTYDRPHDRHVPSVTRTRQ